MPILDDVKEVASKTAQKARLHAEMLMLSRKITSRTQAFGVEMYTHTAPMTERQDFYANDDKLTQVLRPALLTANKDICALQNRLEKVTEQMEAHKLARAGAFPVPAETAGEKLKNAGKATGMAAIDAKFRTELAVVQRQILGHQHEFGMQLYPTLSNLEDEEGWLPTDRDIRAIYDQARRDVDKLLKAKQEKADLLASLGDGTADNEGDGSFKPPSPFRLGRKKSEKDPSSPQSPDAGSKPQWSEYGGQNSSGAQHSTGAFDEDGPSITNV